MYIYCNSLFIFVGSHVPVILILLKESPRNLHMKPHIRHECITNFREKIRYAGFSVYFLVSFSGRLYKKNEDDNMTAKM